jgi:hypothetical protein
MTTNESFYLVNKVHLDIFFHHSLSDSYLLWWVQLSVADVCCFSVLDAVIREFGEEPLHEHRLIKFHYDSMRSRPRIESYLQSPRRP